MKKDSQKIILYVFISVLSFGVDYGATKVAIYLGSMLFIANAIGWLTGALIHMRLISSFVFGKPSIYLPIFLIYLINFIVSPSLVSILVAFKVDLLISKMCIVLIMFILNYYLFTNLFSNS